MSNNEAACILTDYFERTIKMIARGNRKTPFGVVYLCTVLEASCKAIDLLRATPDKEDLNE